MMEKPIYEYCFCGYKVLTRFYNPTSNTYKIKCTYCGMQGAPSRTKEQAALNWLNLMCSEMDQLELRLINTLMGS